MSGNWVIRYNFPISLPGEPISPLNPLFNQLFIRTRKYDDLDPFLFNIEKQFGKFWISSDYGGCGKSTMLSYITRQLYLKLNELRALPFYFYVPDEIGATVKHTFIKNFLSQFSNIDENLREAARVLNLRYQPDIEKVIQGFETYRGGIRELEGSLVDLNEEKLTEKFFKVLDKVLQPWKEKCVFRKYVLLIDEMDKLAPEEVLRFLNGNQKLFERLYNEYGFVAFLAGHTSWVERIHAGTELNYFQGEIFRIPNFVAREDVSKLIQSRLTQCVFMIPSDNPWTADGYDKLLEFTAGVPRKLLKLASDVMNEAYNKKSPRIGAGLVEEVLVREEHIHEITEYLQTHYETYIKMKEALGRKLDSILYLFYNEPHQQILKIYDDDLVSRTRTLTIELSNEEWLSQTSLLVQIGCLEDKGIVRELSADIRALFDKLSEHPAMIQKLVPLIIRSIGEVKPRIQDIPTPDYQDVIDRLFKNSPGQWFSKAKIYESFSFSALVRSYAAIKFPKDIENTLRRLFEKEFRRYVSSNEKNLLVISEGDIQLFRRTPSTMKVEEKEILHFGCRPLIDEYINFVIAIPSSGQLNSSKLDELIEKGLRMACDAKGVAFEEGILRKRKLFDLYTRLVVPKDLRDHIGFYLRESKQVNPGTSLIQELMRHIFQSLAEMYEAAKPPLEKTAPDDYASLHEIETALRQHVEEMLSKTSSHWWTDRVPPQIREHAEARKQEEEICPWPWYADNADSLMAYVDFSDYAEIMKRRDSWRECFEKTFKDSTQLLASLERLEPIRNAIAHNRVLTPEQKMILSIEKKFITGSIKARGLDK